MAGLNSPQRGAIAALIRRESSYEVLAKPARLGKLKVYPWGASIDRNGKGSNPSNVLVYGLTPRPGVDNLPAASYAVLMRAATPEEHLGWTCNGNLITLELLAPVGDGSSLCLTGHKEIYAEQAL